ncbi:MAG: lytic transglycosylase domain-containing protein, partial [Gammaproteobacteria bacterium]|nr:lytic transglycosylase domain-containing protein [Gammaproteobacteria bacterium]
WLPDTTLAADLWVETVPFSETRGYLRRVLSYTVIYQRRLGQEPTRLRQRMPPVTVPVNRAIGPDESTGNQG